MRWEKKNMWQFNNDSGVGKDSGNSRYRRRRSLADYTCERALKKLRKLQTIILIFPQKKI